jgi:membrane protease YdiL (CAAX protease family)
VTWLISAKLLKGRWQTPVFWAASVTSALLFGLVHLPALMVIFGLNSFLEIPVPFLAEILLLNGLLSMIAAYYLKKSGFLAAVGVHFWTDLVWHVIFGFTLG